MDNVDQGPILENTIYVPFLVENRTIKSKLAYYQYNNNSYLI